MVDLKSLEDKFLKKVDKTDACWLWTGAKDMAGYGTLTHQGIQYKTHRLSFELYKEPIEDGKYICHSCDNPSCVNPDHLWQGSAKENRLDYQQKIDNKTYIIKSRAEKVLRIVLNESLYRKYKVHCAKFDLSIPKQTAALIREFLDTQEGR